MHKLKYWIPAILWMAVIYYLSGRTPTQLHSLFPFIQNFNPGHLLAYFILGLLVYYSLNKTKPGSLNYYWVILIALLYGISDEFHQKFVPGRTPDIMDLINDLIGALVAVLVIRNREKHRQQLTKEATAHENPDPKN